MQVSNGVPLEVNKDYEYEDNDINTILEIITKQDNNRGAQEYVLGTVDNIISNQLSKYVIQRIQMLKKESKRYNLRIPCNLGNYHWVALYITLNDDFKPNTIFYSDPLGHKIDDFISKEIVSLFQTLNISPIEPQEVNTLIQPDKKSCGVLVIEIFDLLTKHHANLTKLEVKKLTPDEIRSLRLQHLNLLKENNKDYFDAFYVRQRENKPTVNAIPVQIEQLSKEVKFSPSELKRIYLIHKAIANFNDKNIINLFKTYLQDKEEYGDEVKPHRDAIKAGINTILTMQLSGTDKKQLDTIILQFFGFEIGAAPLNDISDCSLLIGHEEIKAISNLLTSNDLSSLESFYQEIEERIKSDEEYARKLQEEEYLKLADAAASNKNTTHEELDINHGLKDNQSSKGDLNKSTDTRKLLENISVNPFWLPRINKLKIRIRKPSSDINFKQEVETWKQESIIGNILYIFSPSRKIWQAILATFKDKKKYFIEKEIPPEHNQFIHLIEQISKIGSESYKLSSDIKNDFSSLNSELFTLKTQAIEFSNLSKFNVIMGRNGSGKSEILRAIHKAICSTQHHRYIYASRGNVKIEHDTKEMKNCNVELDYKVDKKKRLNGILLKQLFNKLSLSERQKLSTELSTDSNIDFNEQVLRPFKPLFQNLTLRIENCGKSIGLHFYNDFGRVKVSNLSSGELELYTLAADIYEFTTNYSEGIILLDEPDLHLHADSQDSFIQFLINQITGKNIQIFIVTHSTAIVSSLYNRVRQESKILFLSKETIHANVIPFHNLSEEIEKILPVFGTHPLSQTFNEKPILFVEGEDDERIWQQAVRSSNNSLKVYPCVTGSISEMNNYETIAAQIIGSIYDNPKAYSIRDSDDKPDELKLESIGALKRFKLHCRNAESLLLSDEVLQSFNIEWDNLKKQIDIWIEEQKASPKPHPRLDNMKQFQHSSYDRKKFDLKKLRNILLVIFEKTSNESITKPWEVIVGQIIGELACRKKNRINGENSIIEYLGSEFVENIMPHLSPKNKLVALPTETKTPINLNRPENNLTSVKISSPSEVQTLTPRTNKMFSMLGGNVKIETFEDAIKNVPDINRRNCGKTGDTALMTLLRKKKLDEPQIKILLKYGALWTIKNKEGKTADDLAVNHDKVVIGNLKKLTPST